MTTAALVMAAGSGTRFGGPKQFAELADGVRLVDRAVETVASVAGWVGVVVPVGHEWDGAGVDAVAVGGASRQASIAAGLALVPVDADVVVIHSASHPLASTSLARGAVESVRAGGEAAVPVLALVDVLKRVDDGHPVTIGREGLGLAQSPMAFARSVIDRAFASGEQATDESELVERLGGPIDAIDGESTNIHVVDRVTLTMARAIAASSAVV